MTCSGRLRGRSMAFEDLSPLVIVGELPQHLVLQRGSGAAPSPPCRFPNCSPEVAVLRHLGCDGSSRQGTEQQRHHRCWAPVSKALLRGSQKPAALLGCLQAAPSLLGSPGVGHLQGNPRARPRQGLQPEARWRCGCLGEPQGDARDVPAPAGAAHPGLGSGALCP